MDFSNNGLGWNDSISKDSEDRALIPEGNYNARVLFVEKGEFMGSAKLSACPKAIITLMVDTGEYPTPVTVQLLLRRKLEWKLKEFFRAVGLAKQGEEYRMNWENLKGAKLRVHVIQNTYTDKFGEERTSNQIDKFYDYDDRYFPHDPGWLSEATTAEELEEDIPF